MGTASGDGGIQVSDPLLRQRSRNLDRCFGSPRGGIDDQLSGPQTLGIFGKNRLHFAMRGNAQQYDVARFQDQPGIGSHIASQRRQLIAATGLDIKPQNAMPGIAQTSRNGLAHQAETNQSKC